MHQRYQHLVRVQPRVCGEYFYIKNLVDRDTGSTPRMRGILRVFICRLFFTRFNPAYAGNIDQNAHLQHLAQVQPRVCGEYISLPDTDWSFLRVQPRVCGEYVYDGPLPMHIRGSTPRMRGILDSLDNAKICDRFNPAYAGNILRRSSRVRFLQVQPRVCGEY